jgi:ABC-type antimicrobial peptide transport system permease subunit
MFKHYLKVAFRNMWKYKYQTLVSVVGLAVGFACFATAALWIRYEMTYDTFHKNADRMYRIGISQGGDTDEYSGNTQYPLAGYLKSTFPEIAKSISISSDLSCPLELEGVRHNADVICIDSSFFSMFDVKIIEGSMDFLIPGNKGAAITAAKAKQWFGNENPLGKIIKQYGAEYTVYAVVSALPKRSNYPFDVLMLSRIAEKRVPADSQWYTFYGDNTLVELVPGVDVEAFEKKLYGHKIEQSSIKHMNIMPLTSVRYKDHNTRRDVKFEHIIIFSVAGLLVIMCTLFNYLTLFISRFRIRQRELALRIVCGASNRSLFMLLSVEFFASLVIALLFGLLIINMIIPSFLKLSGISLDSSLIYLESLIYITAIILVSLLAFILILAIFRRRTLGSNIRQSNKKLFRRVSVAFQLVISIGFSFCTIIILKQMHHLHNTDLGFAIKNSGTVEIIGKVDVTALEDKMRQIPEITETYRGSPLIPQLGSIGLATSEWEDKPENAKRVRFGVLTVSEQLLSYYDFRLVEGEYLSDNDTDRDVMINESAVKAFGWHSAVGKTINDYHGHTSTVKGVVKNIYNMSPTIASEPIIYILPNPNLPAKLFLPPTILFKYSEGTWNSCRKKIEDILTKEYSNILSIIYNSEEEYDKFLKSENAMLAILTVVSLICVIVCIFGFVSIVSLTCEERRKEIAIRKINGATVKDILDIFFKEHLTLLAVGALIAFPAGYLIMRRWLEQYVLKTEMSAWIYILILFALFMAIVGCVGGRVYKTSRENPINSIKSFNLPL